jgi:hypothetical protein
MEASMPTFILAFLLMLAAFLLITLAAVARDLWQWLRPIGVSRAAIERPSSFSDLLLLLGVAMAWYNVSSGWIAQLTIYPMYADMSTYGPEAFHGFGRGYLSRLPVIVLPAGVMCLAWGLLLWLPCRNVPKRVVWTIVAFCVAFVAVTPIPGSVQTQMSAEGFSNALQTRLLWSNGIRAIIFTAIGLLALNAARRRWMISEPPGAQQRDGADARSRT